MTSLVILDRDGVINKDSFAHIKSPEEVEFISGSIEAIVHLSIHGYYIAVATNQSGVARGLYDEYQLSLIHQKIITSVAKAGGKIDWIVYCPHLPSANCNCRKPKPGMLHRIAQHFRCNLSKVPFIGDRISDIQAAIAAQAIPIHIDSDMSEKEQIKECYPNVPVFSSLWDCVQNGMPPIIPPMHLLKNMRS